MLIPIFLLLKNQFTRFSTSTGCSKLHSSAKIPLKKTFSYLLYTYVKVQDVLLFYFCYTANCLIFIVNQIHSGK
jgi:hypothetical protein